MDLRLFLLRLRLKLREIRYNSGKVQKLTNIFLKQMNAKCNGCSPIKVKENFTPPSSFQRFQICPDSVFLLLTFVNCIIHYTADYRCITCCSITPDN